MELSAGGWPTAAQDYTPYGKSVGTPIADHYKFTGKERDDETTDASGNGLDYFGFRHLSASMGRWMTPDPSGLEFADPGYPQSLNLFAYVMNSPLSLIDPNGLSTADPAPECAGSLDEKGGHPNIANCLNQALPEDPQIPEPQDIDIAHPSGSPSGEQSASLANSTGGGGATGPLASAGANIAMGLGIGSAGSNFTSIPVLSITTINPGGGPHAYNWDVQFSLDRPVGPAGGYIYQQIVGRLNGSPVNYTEAWPVPGGSRIPYGTPHTQRDDRFFTVNTADWVAKAFFIYGRPLYPGMRHGRVPEAGDLLSIPSTPFIPGPRSNVITRHWQVY